VSGATAAGGATGGAAAAAARIMAVFGAVSALGVERRGSESVG